MTDINELERRMSYALERIRQGVKAQAVPAAPEPAVSDAEAEEMAARILELESQLDEERTANAQLEERVKALKERQDTKINDLSAEVDSQRAVIAGHVDGSEKLRALNAELRGVSEQLRDAMENDLSEPHLVNKALMAELDALKAVREADKAEVEAIVSELRVVAGTGTAETATEEAE